MEKQSRTLIAGFVAAAAALLLFAWLAGAVLRGQTLSFDLAVRGAVHAWASVPLTQIMRGVTQLGSAVFLISLALLVVWRLLATGRRHAAALLVINALGAEALEQILKLVFRRPRPEPFFGFVAPANYSFPSGHAIESACFYGVLAAILTARAESATRTAAVWTFTAVLVAAIGFSRIYLGVHYPSDVLAGYAAAVIWVAAVRAGYSFWLRRRAGAL